MTPQPLLRQSSTAGLCECGCGKPTNLAKFSDGTKGHVQGRPMRFLRGHGVRQDTARRRAAIPKVGPQAVELYEAGLTAKQVAGEVGVSEWSVWKLLREAGVQPRPRGVAPMTASRKEAETVRKRQSWRAVVDLYDEGYSAREISERLPKTLPASPSAVYNLLREFGVTRRPRGSSSTPGERSARRHARVERERKRVAADIRRSIQHPASLEAVHPDSFARPSRGEVHIRLADMIPDTRASADPQREIESQLFDSLVGDLTIEDVGRLDDWQLRQLQQRLIEAGFMPGNVQAKERDRLRDSARHRGQAPATVGQGHMAGIGEKRKRRHKVDSNRHSRPSQKPRKAWERAA